MIRIRPLTAQDVPLGMRLKEQAGWNQTEADWKRFLALQPDGGFVAEYDGTPVGTTLTCLFGPVAWVAMVLVEPSLRGRGIGTALMQHALAFLDGRGARSVRLDATPLGRPVYEKLGFVAQYELARFAGVLPTTDGPAADVRPVEDERFDKLLALDEQVTRTDRRKLLTRMYEEGRREFRVVDGQLGPIGYLWARPGSNAVQIGPWEAITAHAGEELLRDAQHRYGGKPVYIDVPLPNEAAVRLVEATGLSVQRRLLRMGRGEPVCERVEWLWAGFGPELG